MTVVAPINSRFKITERPFAAPGKCAVCGAVDRPVVDFGLNIEWYGRVYFCTECLTEVAQIIQMVPLEMLHAVDKGSRQSITSYLNNHNLKVITDEQYVSILGLVSSLSDVASSIRDSSSDEAPVDDAENAPTESGTKSADADQPNRTNEQDDRDSGSEGPSSVPADSSDGTDPFA